MVYIEFTVVIAAIFCIDLCLDFLDFERFLNLLVLLSVKKKTLKVPAFEPVALIPFCSALPNW